MNAPGGKAYRPWTPDLYAQQAHAPAAKLPDDDLVFFLLDVVPKLDLSPIHAVYQDETRGAPPFDPAMMTCLLLYSYCVGVVSSRKIARACERNLAFLAIVGSERPDFRTISLFRKDHLDAFADVFVQVLRLAAAAGLVRLGTIAVDGTKVQGNASRHKAMSYGYMTKEVVRIRAEIDALLKQAQEIDGEDDAALGTRRGDELPGELGRRQDRLAVIEEAMKRLEAEAKAAADVERQRRAEEQAERQASGKKRRGRQPGPIVETPSEKADQLHGPRVVDDEDDEQGLGLLRQRAGERRWSLPDHRGVRGDRPVQRQAAGRADGRGHACAVGSGGDRPGVG